MKTTKFSEDTVLVAQMVLDHRIDLLLNIYQVGKKFCFRYLASNKDSLIGRIDPVNNTENFNWGHGEFNSPDQAQDAAYEFYLNYGHYQFNK